MTSVASDWSSAVCSSDLFVVDGRNGGPPLVLMPSLTLMMMDDAASSTNRDVKFLVSGTVTEYKGKNYLLPEQVSRGGKPVRSEERRAGKKGNREGRAAVR